MQLGLYGQILVNVVHALQLRVQVQQDDAEFALLQVGAEQQRVQYHRRLAEQPSHHTPFTDSKLNVKLPPV